MKSIQEPTCCLSRRNTQPQGLANKVAKVSAELKDISALKEKVTQENNTASHRKGKSGTPVDYLLYSLSIANRQIIHKAHQQSF